MISRINDKVKQIITSRNISGKGLEVSEVISILSQKENVIHYVEINRLWLAKSQWTIDELSFHLTHY